MAKLTWEELDRCATAEEIVDLLRNNQIKGELQSHQTCPLAVATGWWVDREFRWLSHESLITESLTPPEVDFVYRFDELEWEDLIDEVKRGDI